MYIVVNPINNTVNIRIMPLLLKKFIRALFGSMME
jgi:hypothetical protein